MVTASSRGSAHVARIALLPRDALRNPEIGRAAAIRRIVGITALAVDDGVDEGSDIHSLYLQADGFILFGWL